MHSQLSTNAKNAVVQINETQMKKYISVALLMCILCLLLGCKKTEPKNPEDVTTPNFRPDGTLNITNSTGSWKATFTIEIAETENELMQGLKYRESMQQDQGMLFIFAVPDIYDFWMQDTYLPLDMLFIAADGTINFIYENAKPFSEERITPANLHKYVLEVNAGIVKKFNIQTGDKVTWKKQSS